MLAVDRHRRILELVTEESSVRVSDLSERFSVTEETIRRDLFRLESEGKLVRTHGGAVSTTFHDALEVPYSQREIFRINEKRLIAERAVKMVQAGDRIALDASTTTWQMARLLPDVPLTVITNSIKVVLELAPKDNIDVITLGGELASRSLSFIGPLTERSIGNYHVQKLFISCQGVDITHGVSEATETQGNVKAKLLDNSDLAVLLADSSKFGKRGFSRFCSISDINVVITDDEIDVQMANSLSDKLVSVSTVKVD